MRISGRLITLGVLSLTAAGALGYTLLGDMSNEMREMGTYFAALVAGGMYLVPRSESNQITQERQSDSLLENTLEE